MPINYEAAKTLVNGLIQKMKSFRGNWEQNDPTADDYIKNRPFYTEQGELIIIPKTFVEEDDNGYGISFVLVKTPLEKGKNYNVVFDGASYSCTCYMFDSILALGNSSIITAQERGAVSGGEDTGEPFFIINYEQEGIILTPTVDSHTIEITTFGDIVHKIDNKYLPEIKYNYISYDKNQDLTYDQQEIALYNMGDALYDMVSNEITNGSFVKYTTQSLTDVQKLQARTNIGAGDGDYNSLRNKICYTEEIREFNSDFNINSWTVQTNRSKKATLGSSLTTWSEEIALVEFSFKNYGTPVATYKLNKTMSTSNSIYYGNPCLVDSGYLDTGEKICVYYTFSGKVLRVAIASDMTTYTSARVTGYSSTIHKLDEKYIPDTVQSDWNQTDSTSLNFIKNKPSITEVALTGDYNDLSNTPCYEVFIDTLLPGSIPSPSTLSGSVYCSAFKLSGVPVMNEGYIYYLPEINWYGKPKRYMYSTAMVTTLGNAALIKELAESDRNGPLNAYYNSYSDTGEDFCYVQYATGSGADIHFKSVSKTQNGISGVMYQREIEIKQLDEKFIPGTIATKEYTDE